jgi:hypothetical protein
MWRAEAYKQAGNDVIERPQQTEGEEPNMKRELYDFTVPPDTPKDVYTTMYYFPHDKGSSRGLYPTAPAFREPPCMTAHYDKDGNLLFTRFIFKDGTYRDEQNT